MSPRLTAATSTGDPSSNDPLSTNVDRSHCADETPSTNNSSPFDILYTNNDSTPIERLPDELFLRIFNALSSQNPLVDIGNSRLVSKRFKNSSSPYLLTTVVIAERKETLEKLREVMEHPFFSLHVTHLEWDASYFRKDMMLDFSLFKEELHGAMGCWNRPSLGDSHEFVPELLDYQPHKEDVGSKQDSVLPLPGDEAYDMAGVGDVIDEVDLWEIWEYNECYAQYSRRCIDQELMRKKMLAYTDFRALSRHNEDYSDLTKRVFGSTLRPSLMFRTVGGKGGKVAETMFLLFMKELVKIRPKLRSFTIGHNNFNLPQLYDEIGVVEDLVHDHEVISCVPRKVYSETGLWSVILPTVRSLRLPIATTHNERREYELSTTIHQTVRLLSQAPALEHLGLMTDAHPLRPQYWQLTGRPSPFFRIVSLCTFPALRSLELRGWTFAFQELENFIFRRRAYLRYIHIIDCLCIDSYATALNRISQLWPQNLRNLDGAEVVGLRFRVRASTPGRRARLHECAFFTRHRDDDEVYDVPVQSNGRQHPIGLCPGRRLEMEAAILGGRANNVSRQANFPDETQAMVDWWDVPAQFC